MSETATPGKPKVTRARVLEHPPGSIRFDWVITGLSVWSMTGLYLDGWAHNHGKVDDGFFTYWHAILYSGILIMFAFLVFNQLRNMSRGHSWRKALPQGYLVSAIGAALFLLGGALDFLWHTLFGIEANVETLLSPPHLLLATSGILVISGPIRAALSRLSGGESRGWWMLGPLVLSATISLSVATFFTQFAHPINKPGSGNDVAADQVRISDIYVMNADGTGQTRVTASPDMYARYSAWSPNGRQAVITRGRGNEYDNAESALYLMNADGSSLMQLTDMLGHEYLAA